MLLVLVSGSVSDMSVHSAAVFVYPCFLRQRLCVAVSRPKSTLTDACCVLVFLAVYVT